MKAHAYTALGFNHPDLDTKHYGVNVLTNGQLAMVSGKESVRQAIILLLSTIPGERVMRPKYGSNLFQLAFLPNDASTHGLAIYYVRTALEQWEPRIDIVSLDADANKDYPEKLDITLYYRIRRTQYTDQLTLAFELMGASK